jgi:glycosyltransferase involved in cell wall biosynthesis
VGVARDRICVIRNGIDTNRFNPAARAAARQQLAIASDDVVIGTVGRLVPVKDQSMLLRAAAELKRRTRRFRLLLAGDGPLRDALQEQAHALGIQNEVSFLGERRDVEVVLAACDVFVLSSLSEGLSNTILEAMSTGLPVVATRVGGADELVDDGRTGVLVPPAQPDALATALASLIDDPAARRTMGAAGRLKAEREFSIARMAADYEALYATVAGGVSSLTRSDAGAPVCVA